MAHSHPGYSAGVLTSPSAMLRFKEKLESNRIQLQQVEAALLRDSGNADLQKLKYDLEQLIALTQQVLNSDVSCCSPGCEKESRDRDVPAAPTNKACSKEWAVGDRCLAPSSSGQYREATVEDVTEDKEEVAVLFDHNHVVDVIKPHLLQEVSSELLPRKRRRPEGERQRRHKRLQFYHKLEEQREAQKHRWQNFLHSNQAVKKATKSSIFASPETEAGRVGVGTCGHSGLPMTEFRACNKPLKKK